MILILPRGGPQRKLQDSSYKSKNSSISNLGLRIGVVRTIGTPCTPPPPPPWYLLKGIPLKILQDSSYKTMNSMPQNDLSDLCPKICSGGEGMLLIVAPRPPPRITFSFLEKFFGCLCTVFSSNYLNRIIQYFDCYHCKMYIYMYIYYPKKLNVDLIYS